MIPDLGSRRVCRRFVYDRYGMILPGGPESEWRPLSAWRPKRPTFSPPPQPDDIWRLWNRCNSGNDMKWPQNATTPAATSATERRSFPDQCWDLHLDGTRQRCWKKRNLASSLLKQLDIVGHQSGIKKEKPNTVQTHSHNPHKSLMYLNAGLDMKPTWSLCDSRVQGMFA